MRSVDGRIPGVRVQAVEVLAWRHAVLVVRHATIRRAKFQKRFKIMGRKQKSQVTTAASHEKHKDNDYNYKLFSFASAAT